MDRVNGLTADSRAIASTPYDTAWVAGLPDPADRKDPRFPSALHWIVSSQLPDGSWGSPVPYVPDRIICTLAALTPLARFGRRESDRLQVRRGERYLWQHAHLLQRERCDLVGFELLLPTLIEIAVQAGVKVPPRLHVFEDERAHKLKLLPSHLIYSPKLTIMHSLEFLGAEAEPLKLLHAQGSNGSIGNSPAATAFLLHHVENRPAVAYLERCLDGDNGRGVSVLEPCETFVSLRVAYHRWLAGTPAKEVMLPALQKELVHALSTSGVSLSASFPVPDADGTAIALILFHEAGVHVEPDALRHFERGEHFVSFPYERHPSTSVNAHVLQALGRYPNYPHRDNAIAKIIDFLRVAREQDSYWLDKWHISPFYATSRAVVALTELGGRWKDQVADLIDDAVEWFLQTQNADGSWGYFGLPTVEETAYAVHALQIVKRNVPGRRHALQTALSYIKAHRGERHPPLWVDKCLFYPPQIVQAAIQAALDRAEQSGEEQLGKDIKEHIAARKGDERPPDTAPQ